MRLPPTRCPALHGALGAETGSQLGEILSEDRCDALQERARHVDE